jgi:hypothetical protein
LRRAMRDRANDVILPEDGSDDEEVLREWNPKTKEEEPPVLSLQFRLKRAIRVIPITVESIAKSLKEFDKTVGRIEKCVAQEAKTGVVIASWEKNASHEPTCEACDSKTYCPEFEKENEPRLPGHKM